MVLRENVVPFWTEIARAPLFLFLFLLMGSIAPAQTRPAPAEEDRVQEVQATARLLVSTYDVNTGLFRGTGWWNSANGISALVNAARALHTASFDPVFQTAFTAAQHKNPGFLNEFYDDEGWWALAWLDVYGLRGDKRYLEMSKTIFADMTTGWSDTCGGGIWWKKYERYKNAIANELFLAVATRLASATSGRTRARYLSWALREERWFVSSGMVNEESLVNDGLDSACHNNKKTTWTYNQGVLLSGLAQLATLTRDPAPLHLAGRVADAAAIHLVDAQGTLHDPCEPECGADGVQFKGIFLRNLITLEEAIASPRMVTLIRNNAESVWRNARTESGQFAVDWSGPPHDDGTGSLISALDALTAPLLLKPMKG